MPKSVTLTRPSASSITLWGLMSRCTIPRRCAKRRAFSTPIAMSIARSGATAPSPRTISLIERPGRNSIAM
jgi:hypothetical protein